MPNQQDLDQGGTFRAWNRESIGASIGWINAPANNVFPITTAGPFTIDPNISIVTVNVSGAVTITLPSATDPAVPGVTLPGLYANNPITIVDIGGNAAAHPITIQPAAGENIMGLASISLNVNYGGYTLLPVSSLHGWIVSTTSEPVTSLTNNSTQILAGGANKVLIDTGGVLSEVTATAGVYIHGGQISLPGPFVNILDYGADPTGATDSTSAINAAYASLLGAGGTVIWPAGTYRCNSTVICGCTNNTGNPTSFINTWCPAGNQNTILSYHGANNTICFRLACNKYYVFSGLTINNDGGATGCTGLAPGGGPGQGSGANVSLQALIMNTNVNGWATAVQDIDGGMSEFCWINMSFANNALAYTQNTFNTLDATFINLAMSSNTVGIDGGVSENVNIFGGSATANGVDFKVEQNNNQFNVHDYRSENCTGNNVLGAGNGGAIRLKSCRFKDLSAPHRCIAGNFLDLSIEDSNLFGTVQPTFVSNSLTMTHTSCWPDTQTGLPFRILNGNAGFAAGNTHVTVKNCYVDQTTSPAVGANFQLSNFEGTMVNQQQNLAGGIACQLLEPSLWIARDQQNPSGTGQLSTYGTDWAALCHVRHLGEGSPPGAFNAYDNTGTHGTPTFGQNLRIQGTFASSGTLAITFQRNITVTAHSSAIWTSTWKPSDRGKQINIPSGVGGQPGGLTYFWGYVVHVISSTQAYIEPGGQNVLFNVDGLTVTVGTNEPDGNYMVFVQGVSGETYGVSAITSTGFTVTSSNAASTATVTCLIVR